MIPVPLLIGAGGALANFLGGFFGGKSKANNEKKRAAESDAAQRRAWDQQELLRIGRLKSIISAAQARGINIGTIDPSLLQPRPYPGPNSTVGIQGPSLLSGLLNFAGNTAMGAAQAGFGGGGIPGQAEAARRGPIVGIEDQILAGGPPQRVLPPPSADVNAGSGGYSMSDEGYPF